MKTVGFLVETRFYKKSSPVLHIVVQDMYGFKTLSAIASAMDIRLILGSIEDYQKKMFTVCFEMKGGKLVRMKNQKIDAVLDRSLMRENSLAAKKRLQKEVPTLNKLDLSKLCWDKYATYNKFKKFMAPTFLVHTKSQLNAALGKISTEKVVLKPRRGISGMNVFIGKKREVDNDISRDTIVQEFVDSSKGIPSLKVKGVHDLRLVTISGKLQHAYIRRPKSGLISNIARGGSVKHLKDSEVPKDALNIMKEVDKQMEQYGDRIYTVDIMYNENGKPILNELESIPVIRSAYKNPASKPAQKKFLKHLIKTVVQTK